jgi:predicted PurR-regulated permease PerM
MVPASPLQPGWHRVLLDVLLRAGLVAVLAVACFNVFRPFLELMLWAVILAITLYPLQARLRRRSGWKDGHVATLIVVVAIAVLVVPVYLMAATLAETAQNAIAVARGGGVHVPPPPDSVAGWPIVGPRLHALWSQAATDLTSLARKFAPQIRHASVAALGKLAGAGLELLLFLAALAIAGIVMAFADAGTRASERIAARLFGAGRGHRIAQLCTATIRAVAQGVVGIAFIQALLIGVGFALMGIPATAVLVLVVLLLGIMQVPATLVTVPVIIYVLATQGFTAGTIVFSVYVFIAGLLDNVLKPLLLGRGVEVPMPVVLIGALGGMIVMGIVGLFIGPVLLAVGYLLFWQWVDDAPSVDAPPAAMPAPDAAADETLDGHPT